jgi:glycerophosphoryl diester phosphodiesterase
VCVAGTWDGLLAQVHREVPAVTTALGWRSLTTLLMCARAGVWPARALANAPFTHVPVKLGRVPIFVERVVAMSYDLRVRVVWTVDEPQVMRRLLDAGVDTIIADRPDQIDVVTGPALMSVGRPPWSEDDIRYCRRAGSWRS